MKKDTYRLLDVLAVLITVVGKIVFDDSPNSKLILLIAAIFWIGYIIIRLITSKGIHKDWGFRKTNFQPTMIWVAIVGGISICGFITYGLLVHHVKFSMNILYSVLVYPIWGLAQQLFFISLVAGNLKNCQRIKFSEFQILAFTSILFCFVHYPDPCLMIPTFFMAIFFTMMFLKYRNIYPLAIFHGVVGAIFYYFVLNEDPWAEMISEICNTLCN